MEKEWITSKICVGTWQIFMTNSTATLKIKRTNHPMVVAKGKCIT
jgi:hypothetical protein